MSIRQFILQCVVLTAILAFTAWYLISHELIAHSDFFGENVNLYGVLAIVLSLYSLWYTYLSYVSQSRTESNTGNVPLEHQIRKFEGLARHEYRNMVCVLAMAIRFFDKANGEEMGRHSYPSESNILKLQAAPEDFVLDVNARMAATVSELQLLLRNVNIEIQVTEEHLSRRDIHDSVLYQDFDNLIFKPLFLVDNACAMEVQFDDLHPETVWERMAVSLKWKPSRHDRRKVQRKLLLERTIRIMVREHLKKLPRSLNEFLLPSQKGDAGSTFRDYSPYLRLLGGNSGLEFKGVDHTGAIERTFLRLISCYGGTKSEERIAMLRSFRWNYDEEIKECIHEMDHRLSQLEQSPYYELLKPYRQLLRQFRETHVLDFPAFFPQMLRLDAIVETRNIGMVNF